MDQLRRMNDDHIEKYKILRGINRMDAETFPLVAVLERSFKIKDPPFQTEMWKKFLSLRL